MPACEIYFVNNEFSQAIRFLSINHVNKCGRTLCEKIQRHRYHVKEQCIEWWKNFQR